MLPLFHISERDRQYSLTLSLLVDSYIDHQKRGDLHLLMLSSEDSIKSNIPSHDAVDKMSDLNK